jgi:hypothetical protein
VALQPLFLHLELKNPLIFLSVTKALTEAFEHHISTLQAFVINMIDVTTLEIVALGIVTVILDSAIKTEVTVGLDGAHLGTANETTTGGIIAIFDGTWHMMIVAVAIPLLVVIGAMASTRSMILIVDTTIGGTLRHAGTILHCCSCVCTKLQSTMRVGRIDEESTSLGVPTFSCSITSAVIYHLIMSHVVSFSIFTVVEAPCKLFECVAGTPKAIQAFHTTSAQGATDTNLRLPIRSAAAGHSKPRRRHEPRECVDCYTSLCYARED